MRNFFSKLLFLFSIALPFHLPQFGLQHLSAGELAIVAPAEVGMSSAKLEECEAIIREGIQKKQMPGCVVCMGRRGKIAFLHAFGSKQTEPSALPMEIDTVFDMASITKPVATATSIMILIERGSLNLSDRIADHFPNFGVNGKESITVEHLLVHQSGLIPDNALSDYMQGPDQAWDRICNLKITCPVGSEFKYSDVNFIVLGELVRKVSGKNLADFGQAEIFNPLGMSESGFLPDDALKSRAAPTEQRDGNWIRGEVHDPRAFRLGGIAGHAGLFSTAKDMAIYAEMMLEASRSERNGERRKLAPILSHDSLVRMTRAHPVTIRSSNGESRVGARGLGWDKQTGYSINRGQYLSDSAFGHGGFTGTVLWIDPELDLFFIFLSNRVHPDGKGSINSLAGELVDIAAKSILPDRP